MSAKNHLTDSEASSGDAGPRLDAVELLALLGRDLRRIQEELTAIGASVAMPSSAEVAAAARELKDSIGGFLEKAQAATIDLSRQASERTRQLHDQMEKHPFAAVSSAFALGYVLGRTMARPAHAAGAAAATNDDSAAAP